MSQPRVALLRCPAAASEAEIIARTREAIELSGGLAERLRGKRRILVKPNVGIDRIVLNRGRQTELTEPAVVEGVVQAIRAVSAAEILVGECPHAEPGVDLYAKLGYRERLRPYADVRLVDFASSPYKEVPVPGQPLQFTHYWLNSELATVDATVSVAKMKAHLSMGCTLTIKNLFGLAPPNVYGQPRRYLHDRLIRLPRVLVDLAAIFHPVLNVIDGIMTANHSEWRGEAIETGVLLAGDNPVATDAAGMLVMGFDPLGDYPHHPHWYRRNSIKLAAENGLVRPTASSSPSSASSRRLCGSRSRSSRTERARRIARRSCRTAPAASKPTSRAATASWTSIRTAISPSGTASCSGMRRAFTRRPVWSASEAPTGGTRRCSRYRPRRRTKSASCSTPICLGRSAGSARSGSPAPGSRPCPTGSDPCVGPPAPDAISRNATAGR